MTYNIEYICMIKEAKILASHGRQYIKDLRSQKVSEIFRGRPIIAADISASEIKEVASICPVSAIHSSTGAIDMGKCLFCNECAFILPDKIKFTNDYRIAVNKAEDLLIQTGIDAPVRLDEHRIRKEIRRMFKGALKLRQVSAAGDNSCEMELAACGNVNFDMGRFGIEFVASPRHADGVVITGPISDNMSEALQICYDAIPTPKLIILAGTDAISGGIFSESKALNREFLEKHPVDLYVPGNPIHPLTFINGILDLLGL
jgi:Ni,Fe-hydrogenase III small subunit